VDAVSYTAEQFCKLLSTSVPLADFGVTTSSNDAFEIGVRGWNRTNGVSDEQGYSLPPHNQQ